MKHGKFEDFSEENPDQFEEDIYGDTERSSYEEDMAAARLQQRVNVQKIEEPIYEQVQEIEKTMDLKFVNGILFQKVVERSYTLEVLSGESKLDKMEEKWQEIPSENTFGDTK